MILGWSSQGRARKVALRRLYNMGYSQDMEIMFDDG